MIEQIYQIATGDEKAVEKVIMDDNIHYIHMVLTRKKAFRSIFQIPMCT